MLEWENRHDLNEQATLNFHDVSYFMLLLQHLSLERFNIVYHFVVNQLTLFDVSAILYIIGKDDEIGVQN